MKSRAFAWIPFTPWWSYIVLLIYVKTSWTPYWNAWTISTRLSVILYVTSSHNVRWPHSRVCMQLYWRCWPTWRNTQMTGNRFGGKNYFLYVLFDLLVWIIIIILFESTRWKDFKGLQLKRGFVVQIFIYCFQNNRSYGRNRIAVLLEFGLLKCKSVKCLCNMW